MKLGVLYVVNVHPVYSVEMDITREKVWDCFLLWRKKYKSDLEIAWEVMSSNSTKLASFKCRFVV